MKDRRRQYNPTRIGSIGAIGEPVTPSEAQSALDALRGRGVVVRLERGLYTLEDGSVPDWFAARQADEAGRDGSGGRMQEDHAESGRRRS